MRLRERAVRLVREQAATRSIGWKVSRNAETQVTNLCMRCGTDVGTIPHMG
jgi:hypothetical protein